ncbi:hypothetical protein ACRS8P_17830 [Burkholderia cenocepacia]
MNQIYYTEEARDNFFKHLKEIGFVENYLAEEEKFYFWLTDFVSNKTNTPMNGYVYDVGNSINFFDIEMLAEQLDIDYSYIYEVNLKSRLMEIYTILDEKFKTEKLLSSNVKTSKDRRF